MNIQEALAQIESNQTLNRDDVQLLVTAIKTEGEDLEMLETYLHELSFVNQETINKIVGDMYSYEY